MCGVAGIFDLKGDRPIDQSALKRMTDAIAHRGPDGEGFFFAPGIGLGHRRLAIIDIEGGAQPFIASDDASVLSFNGEIYNYRDLRRRHAERGVRLKTRSDTEALAEGLLREGCDYLGSLRGMFAFAFWNAAERRLTLARDRFGEKPLYYAETPDGFLLFASEIGAIRASGLAPLIHSTQALHDYFFFGYVPDPKTIYKNVYKLPPGSVLHARRGEPIATSRYWRARFEPDESLTLETARRSLLEIFDDAVASELESEVPLGAFLSGGVDSASIVASIAQSGRSLTTCTIGFDDEKSDERADARATAARYATTHFEEEVSLDASSLIDRIAGVYGEPFADASALPTYLVSAAARKHVTVALSGDGGDELFGGYRRYAMFSNEETLRRMAPPWLRQATFGAVGAIYPKLDWAPRPLRLKTTLQALGERTIDAYARAVSTCLPDRLVRMLSADFTDDLGGYDSATPIRNAAGADNLDPVSLAQKIDFETWLPGRMLTKVDRASMANGLEVRAPFLDHRLAEWALRLPPRLKLGAGGGKLLLKAAQEDRVDRAILYRPKRGFSPPLANWLRDPSGPVLRLRESRLWSDTGCFSEPEIHAMIERHQRGVADNSQELWMLIMFDAFLRHEQA
ncbi:MAG: asparagine synthase (glutamine-hydrolyzing) [Alphaproteobacteria bacterium RIFCSPHIGHO2_12_FULL_63_12]|nr:MAG: asparagine synthase (glutamine-hydrolyzing) [Alphaproteobacteria bacterium RIFCSPHIGHO2_12_FULL_63_12]